MENKKISFTLIVALLLVGFTSMVMQVVIMRELLIVFYGNELALGITLSAWLFWGGIGSLIMGPFLGKRIKRKLLFFATGEILVSLFLPLSLLLTRFIPLILKISSGEIIGTIPMIASSFAIIAPVTFLSGMLFVFGCEIYTGSEYKGAIPIGYVYILEACGA
ncbi:MAG: hypothetical protein B5M53_08690, partial [Candidatus Cloacimonas sp. 4484_209]